MRIRTAWAASILSDFITLAIGLKHAEGVALPITAEAKLSHMPLSKASR